MARKRLAWLHSGESLLKRLHSMMHSRTFRGWLYHPVLVLFLLSLVLTTAIEPVLSNRPSINRIQNLEFKSQEGDCRLQRVENVSTSDSDSCLLSSDSLSSLSAPQLVEQGRAFYTKGDFNEAVTVWQQAVQAYKNQGDVLHQAMALSYLSLAYQRLEQWPDAQTAIQTSLSLLDTTQNRENSQERTQIYAQVLNTHGRLELALGQAETALKTWQLATKFYEQVGDKTGVTGSLINQAQAMEVLGLYRRTCQTLLNALKLDNTCDLSDNGRLETVLQSFEQQPDAQLKVLGFRSLGNILRLMGDLDNSQQLLRKSWTIVQQIQSPYEESVTLISLGKTERAKYSQDKDLYNRTNLPNEKENAKRAAQLNVNLALDYYEKAAQISPSNPLKIQANLHRLNLLIDYYQWLEEVTDETQRVETQTLDSQIQSQVADLLESKIAELPSSQTAIYARLNFAQSLIQLKPNNEFVPRAIAYAEDALRKAKTLNDQRIQSYALGTLGNLYEQIQQWSLAQVSTEQAVMLAQGIQAREIGYQWQWQLGRVLQKQGKEKDAIAAYEVAVKTLKSVRNDLLAVDAEVQFSFRDNIEPIYRELVALLLPSADPNPAQENLQKSLYYIESLQLAELENFLDCNLNEQSESIAALTNRISQVAKEDTTATLIYPIISEQQVAVILKQPNQPLRYHTYTIPKTEVETTISKLQQYLRDPSRTNDIKKLSNRVYEWFIKPFEKELEIDANIDKSSIKTLVFVLDGSLRNIPMAVLYDGTRDRYLLERYAVAVSSGLQLLDPDPLPRQINALVAGLSEERQFAGQTFSPLENVPDELQAIASVVPSQQLLNDTFTQANLQNQLKSGSLSVVHLATHGKFSSNPEETFIILWDKRLNSQDLENLLQINGSNRTKPIELLVLSACETAAGDKRAALGLAGVALQAGARSTLATLWQVNDESTAELMSRFYRQLKADTNITKAEALRRVQLELWANKSKDWEVPFFWAPYVLVGNWL